MAADRRSDRPRAREAVGEGDGDPVRRRRRLGDGTLVRARAPLAALHGARRRDHRDAVLPRRIRLLHGSDLPRRLPLWVGPDSAARAPHRGHPGRGERDALRRFRRHRQRVDEHARRLRPGRWSDGEHRPDRGDDDAGGLSADVAHDARGVRGDGARRGGDPRLPSASTTRSCVPPAGAGDRAHRGRAGGDPDADQRGHQCALRGAVAAGEAGGDGGAIRDRARGRAARRRDSR